MSAFPKWTSLKAELTAAYHYYVPHAFHLGGFQIFPSPGLAFDDLGLDWVRTIVLWSPAQQVGYRIVSPDDLQEFVGHPFPSEEQVIEIYGKPVEYEDLYYFRQSRRH